VGEVYRALTGLSYSPVGEVGFEPTTPGLTGLYSSLRPSTL